MTLRRTPGEIPDNEASRMAKAVKPYLRESQKTSTVGEGGTGRSTATENAVICGGTTPTGTHQSVASVGTAGQVLTSNGAGQMPTFQDTIGESGFTTQDAAITLDQATHYGNINQLTGSTNRTWAFTASATLGAAWFCWVRNAGTAELTLDPDGAETIDGLTSFIMYPGEMRRIHCTGTAFHSIVISTFLVEYLTTSAFTKPPGYQAFDTELWAGGGSGSKGVASTQCGGGGGGGYKKVRVLSSSVGTTETVTIGAGGVAQTVATTVGNVGGNTTFGSFATAYGGGGGGPGDGSGVGSGGGGGGGGSLGRGESGGNNGGSGAGSGDGGGPLGGSGTNSGNGTDSMYGGSGGGESSASDPRAGGSSYWGGAGGGGGGDASNAGGAGGTSVYGGGGGGGSAYDSSPGPGAGGASEMGGDGGAGAYDTNVGTTGSVPGGGGGGSEAGNSGAGGAGKAIISGVMN